jgi:uncharacterized C2H2 Zn-finger protein
MEKKILYCQLCDYKTTRNTDWIRHIKSKQHQNGGPPKSTNCDICNIKLATYQTYRHHLLTKHSTKEERSKSKYYCEVCDIVFISKTIYEKHIINKKHHIQEIVNNSLIDLENQLNL